MGEKKIIVITGANSGIGKVGARELAKKGDTLVMVCRDQEKGLHALEEVKRASNNHDVHLMLCDLSSFESIKNFCNAFKSKFNSLDILINNAGTMIHSRKMTADGYEMHFQVNYLGTVLLTSLLLDCLRPNGRIVNVASLAHKLGNIHFSDINLSKGFSMFKAYGQSKLALILYTYELADRLKNRGITVNCLHPGIIRSNLGVYKDKRIINQLTTLFKFVFTSVEKGAETTIFLASSPTVANVSGKYFVNKKVVCSSKKSYNTNLRKQLWNYTNEVLKLDSSS